MISEKNRAKVEIDEKNKEIEKLQNNINEINNKSLISENNAKEKERN